MTRYSCLTLILGAAMSVVCAYPGGLPIGVANAAGSYSVNDSPVSGQTDLAEGSHLETTATPSEVRLQSGADVVLSPRSVGSVYGDHVVLERGAVRVGSFENYSINARKLQVLADSPGSAAVVRLKGDTVEVASLGGSVRVSDGGAMLAHVAAGTRMSFKQNDATQAQTGAQTGAGAGRPRVASDEHVLLWFIAITAGAAIALGSLAAVQGKSPF